MGDCYKSSDHVEADLNANHNFIQSHIVIKAHPQVNTVKYHGTNFKIKDINICEYKDKVNWHHDKQYFS